MIYQIRPLTDARWETLVARHPRSSVFHTRGWLGALQRTYRYEPVVYTASPPQGELINGLVFCRISSWLTGRRLVSLPFSDHCDPLMENGDNVADIVAELSGERTIHDCKYIEIRPRDGILDRQSGVATGSNYCFHVIDLRCDEKTLFSKFHKDCVQRKIQRAEREKLTYREGRSIELLKMFYKLFLQSRRRQRILSHPLRWFQNLAECMGPAMQVRVALYGDQVAASMVTLQHLKALVYKYGCSDPRLNKLGAMPWLFWKAIREAKSQDLDELDLGRSSWDNQGLITFKDRLGGKRISLNYWKYAQPAARPSLFETLRRPAGWIVERAPLAMLNIAGRILYRHTG